MSLAAGQRAGQAGPPDPSRAAGPAGHYRRSRSRATGQASHRAGPAADHYKLYSLLSRRRAERTEDAPTRAHLRRCTHPLHPSAPLCSPPSPLVPALRHPPVPPTRAHTRSREHHAQTLARATWPGPWARPPGRRRTITQSAVTDDRLQVGRTADWPEPGPGIRADDHIVQQAVGRGGPGPGALGHCTDAC